MINTKECATNKGVPIKSHSKFRRYTLFGGKRNIQEGNILEGRKNSNVRMTNTKDCATNKGVPMKSHSKFLRYTLFGGKGNIQKKKRWTRKGIPTTKIKKGRVLFRNTFFGHTPLVCVYVYI